MGCGCQDIEKDQQIIEYYNKKLMEKQMESQETITWEGSLLDWNIFINDESSIIRIEKIDSHWAATVKKLQ